MIENKLKYLILFIFILSSCVKVEKKQWKHSDGYSIGDWVEFAGKERYIKNDTIFSFNKPIAVIIEKKFRFFDYQLTIKDIQDTTKGYYCSKGNIDN